jgi:hypothetical protein
MNSRSGDVLNPRSGWQHKAWGASPRISDKKSVRAREAGDSVTIPGLSPTPRARSLFIIATWGLRPRLYAVARSAGFTRDYDALLAAVSDCPPPCLFGCGVMRR